MNLARKLNLKGDTRVRVLNKPADVNLDDVRATNSAKADAILAFVKTMRDVDASYAVVVQAAKANRIAWIAYPKAGNLGSDLNRDVLWQHMSGKGVQGVRQVAINNIWSAMRFKPEK